MMVDFLVVLGTATAAAFAALALVTDFHSESRPVRRRGYFVIAGIVISAVLTLVGNWLSSQETEQETLRRHTSLLELVWQENNRIGTGSITVTIEYRYDVNIQEQPTLFRGGWELKLRGVNRLEPHEHEERDRWLPDMIISKPGLDLTANVQQINHRSKTTVDDVQWEQVSVFSQFTGTLGEFSAQSSWNGAWFEVHLTAEGDDALVWPSKPTQEDYESPIGYDEDEDAFKYAARLFSEHYSNPDVVESLDGYPLVGPMRVGAKVTIYVRDRPVFQSTGVPTFTTLWDEDVRGLIVLKFPVTQVAADLVPVFGFPANDPGSSASTAFRWFAMLLMVGLVATIVGVVRSFR